MLSGNRSIYWPAWRLILRRSSKQQAKNLLPFVPIALEKKKKVKNGHSMMTRLQVQFVFFCQDNFTKRFPTYQDWNARQDKSVAMSDFGCSLSTCVPTPGHHIWFTGTNFWYFELSGSNKHKQPHWARIYCCTRSQKTYVFDSNSISSFKKATKKKNRGKKCCLGFPLARLKKKNFFLEAYLQNLHLTKVVLRCCRWLQ